MPIRGLRGAITAETNTVNAIYEATRELMQALIEANQLCQEDVASLLFTVSPDLTAAYPAYAVRQLGWTEVAMLCAQELNVPEGMPRCIRVLAHWNTDSPSTQLRHIYLREAARLRPDRVTAQSNGTH